MMSPVARRRPPAIAALIVFVVFTAVVLTGVPALPAVRPARADPGSSAAPASAAVLELKNLMTGDEYRAAGLEKLSAQELVALDDWIGDLVVRLLTARKRASCSSRFESRIEGEFEGWTGRTVVQLENGQVWRQRSGTELYAYRVSPAVQIHRSAHGCQMKVDGVAQEVPVERLW
jgi:hypothetical protein